MNHPEEWKHVTGFPGYSVNPLGQVRNDASKRLLAYRYNQYGVPYVGMMRDWQQCSRSVPRLVARAFLSEPSDLFDTPIQLDGDRSNCQVDNLMWRPYWYAVRYNKQFKHRYEHPIEAPIRSLSDGNVFPSSLAAGCNYGLLEREVVMSVYNRTPAWPTYQYFELAEMP